MPATKAKRELQTKTAFWVISNNDRVIVHNVIKEMIVVAEGKLNATGLR